MEESRKIIIQLILATTIIIVILVIISLALIYFNSKRRFLYQRKLDNITVNYEKILLNIKIEIQEQTLRNIAQEIHDHIGLSLSLAKLHLNTLGPSENNFNREKITEAVLLISNSIQDLSNISHTLSADTVKKNGLLRAIEEEVERIKRIGILNLSIKVSEHMQFLQDDVELLIFRIIQECLNNTIKHAGAKSACVSLDYQETFLIVTVSDDGNGFVEKNKGSRTGSGLLNIQSRANTINGTCLINSGQDGTQIIITIPYK